MLEQAAAAARAQWAAAWWEFLRSCADRTPPQRTIGVINHPLIAGKFLMDGGHAFGGFVS